MQFLFNIILATALIWLACKYFDLKKTLNPQEKRYSNLVNAISSVIDRAEGYGNSHGQEVADLSIKIASKTSINSNLLISLEIAAKLHDLGMLMIMNDSIKSRHKLKNEEMFLMKNHPLLAEHYLKHETAITDEIPTIIRWHHERWDGFGYPDSLKGEQIPLPSRILAIADAISAMRNQRNYRKKNYKTNKDIIDELKRQAGLQFDPSLVNIAVSILEEEGNLPES